ncbi:MAG: VanW family protein [Leptolinea sp.]
MSSFPTRHPRPTNIPLQIILTLLAGFFLFSFFLLIASGLYQVWFAGRIYPGVSMLNVDLSGLTPRQAEEKIAAAFTYPQKSSISLINADKTWAYSAAELGAFLDPKASAQNAFTIGRDTSFFHQVNQQLSAARSGKNLAPTYIFDQRLTAAILGQIAAQINHPLVEADINITGVEVHVRSGESGRELDQTETLQRIRTLMESMQSGTVELAIKTTEPAVINADQAAAVAKKILSAPLNITMPPNQADEMGPWSIDPQTLSGMLAIVQVPEGDHAVFQVELNNQLLLPYLNNLANKTNLLSQNARFIFNDTEQKLDILENAVIGRTLNASSSIGVIQQKVSAGEHDVVLAFDFQNPAVKDDATTDSLGIKELVGAETSFFYGSSAERVQNITAAAARFHGVLLAPGETYSMAKGLGDISLDNGFAEALIIYGGRTIKGVGGGVCQVSTTLFRAAFFAGFPIVERHPHAYRVSYYEKIAGNHINPLLAGMDATVYVPVVDFRFTNDTPNWLLMETYVNPEKSSITWKFYSTKDGREIKWDASGPTNIVEAPEPLYKENPELEKGDIQQIDWAADGADVTVRRTVTKNGQPYLEDDFITHYQPWQSVFEYGPGTENIPTPSPEETATPTP